MDAHPDKGNDPARRSTREGISHHEQSVFSGAQTKSQMLVLGTIFHCLNPILSITALLSSKPLFSTTDQNKRDEASRSVVRVHRLAAFSLSYIYRSKEKFIVQNSDLLTYLEAFNQCQKLRDQGKNLKSFCNEVDATAIQCTGQTS